VFTDTSPEISLSKFCRVVGSVTGGMIGIIVALLIVVAKYGPKVHKFAMNLFGTGAMERKLESSRTAYQDAKERRHLIIDQAAMKARMKARVSGNDIEMEDR
jgi:hypothetical protein